MLHPRVFSLLFAGCILLPGACYQQAPPSRAAAAGLVLSEKVQGLTLVAPPDPFPADPFPAVRAAGADWVAVVPYAFTPPDRPEVRYNVRRWQWWGELPEGIAESVRLAHAAGCKVMLKPQVYVPRGWTGTLDFPDTTAWATWEKGYSDYILSMAVLADSLDVELFCFATEFRTAIAKRPDYWRGLIRQIRAQYRGALVYSANWDDWEQTPFWDELDYIGLGGYFPLDTAATPGVDRLKKAWEPICARLKPFSARWNKPVLFTEFGYLSVDRCGWRNWELESGIEQRPINEQAQANCYEAMLSLIDSEPWCAGGFVWKWFPNGRGHEGYPERDYTPQGKLAEQVLAKWWK